MNGLLNVKDAAAYCSEPAGQLLQEPDQARHRTCLCAGFSQAHLLLRRRFGSVDADLGTHYAQKEGCGA